MDDVHEAEQDVLNAVTRLVQWHPNQPIGLTVVLVADEEKTEFIGTRLLDLCDLRVELHAWLENETREFIEQAVTRSGYARTTFAPDAISRIHELAGGIPRRIRQIAELSLVAGTTEPGSVAIQSTIIDLVQAELRGGATNSGF